MSNLICKTLTPAIGLALLAGSAMSAPLKVDLSQSGRNDTGDPNYIEWPVQGGQSISRTFEGITVTFSNAGGGIRGDWFRAGLVTPALMTTDGLVGEDDSAIEMKIEELSSRQAHDRDLPQYVPQPGEQPFRQAECLAQRPTGDRRARSTQQRPG